MRELADGLFHWTARHPEWHPGDWGAEVGSYAAVAGDELLLIDPQLPAQPDAVLAELDRLAADRSVSALVTIGYHTRDAEQLADRYDGAVHGARLVRRRLRDPGRFAELVPGEPGPGGAVAHPVGRPVRDERPLWLPSHAAIVFGDAVVVTPDGELRMWALQPLDAKHLRFYAERFAPTLEPLLELPVERVLVTHGPPVERGGAAALREAVGAAPWYRKG